MGEAAAAGSVMLEILDFALVLFGGLARAEGAEIPALPVAALLAGVESIFAGLELSDHGGDNA
jgi:hypothetical protein